MSRVESLKIRPYARLLTMLGDQLIKDEVIALIELIKNAYDADATHVRVSFSSFRDDYSSNDESVIVIEDDGNGMNDTILKKAWMNPATPEKLKRKRIRNTTDKGRIMQGEKGIGRFAVFKLGKEIELVTRRQKQNNGHFIDAPETDKEYVLRYDFSEYDEDFLMYGEEEKEIFLDDLSVTLEERDPEVMISSKVLYNGAVETRKPYGTRLVISNLNGKWSRDKIEKIYQSILRMQPIFGDEFEQDYCVYLSVNSEPYYSGEKGIEEIQQILRDKAVFVVDGTFNAEQSTIAYSLTNKDGETPYVFKLSDPEMQGIKPMRDFLDSLAERRTECGSFSYKFYIFDLSISSSSPDTRYYLDQDEKRSIKAHRVYLYRDGIRVMPYGDPEDDWLKLDMIRGVESAGHIFGNDQLVGYIKISQKENPALRDKTNREGLIEDGYAKSDLINICQLVLRYIRSKDFARYRIEKKKRKEAQDKDISTPIHLIAKAREERIGKKAVDEVLNNAGLLKVSDIPAEALAKGQHYLDGFFEDFEHAYRKEVSVLESRITATENLAAIGLSAETAYHDARIILHEANNALGNLLQGYSKQVSQVLERDRVVKDLRPIHKQTKNVANLMNNVQKLFPSTKNKKGEINVRHVITMVKDLYNETLQRSMIECRVNSLNSELVVVCTDAVLLQVFINLFDNALYWLKTVATPREILIEINAEKGTVLFSDSGPGVRKDDIPYIFQAFYSGKGDEGKGLGLYIARQLLERYSGKIDLVDDESKKRLNGANFILTFDHEVL